MIFVFMCEIFYEAVRDILSKV